MDAVRYVHAADLHLDVAFKGAVSQFEDVSRSGRQLWEATFTALERLVRLCERERPDFVVLAGDIYNEEDHSLRAQFALRDACKRLEAHGISVFIAHGNHEITTESYLGYDYLGRYLASHGYVMVSVDQNACNHIANDCLITVI